MNKYSQIKAMLAISKASFRSFTRSPSAIVFSLAFPFIFIIVFGFIGGSTFKVNVIVSKNCQQYNPVYQTLVHVPNVTLVPETNEDSTKLLLTRGKIAGVLDIEKDSLGKLHINLQTSEAAAEKRAILISILDGVILNIYKTSPDFANMNLPVYPGVEETVVQGREYKTIDFILPGQLGFSLLSSGVFGVAFLFFNLRQQLVLKRFFATPIKKPYIVLGEAISRLIFALLGAVIILFIGHYVFGFTLIHGFTTLISLLFLCAVGLIVFMGFGFIVSGVSRNESTIPAMANLFTLPQFLLAGTFFDYTVFPTWLQPVSKILPLTYLNQAMRKVAFDGVSIFSLGTEFMVLAIWGIVLYAIAVWVFRWE